MWRVSDTLDSRDFIDRTLRSLREVGLLPFGRDPIPFGRLVWGY